MPSSSQVPHLFIDTNVLLSFYAFTKDDLEQLKKLVGLIKTGKLVLYVTAQVRDEFARNRESKVSETIRTFEKAQTQQSLPRFMEAYKQAGDYYAAANALQKARDQLVTQAKQQAEKKELAADILVANLLEATASIEFDQTIFNAAHTRMILGNPPGKSGSIGDRLNWEVLLANVPDGIDLHIISKDGDFESALGPRPHRFLLDEWAKKKKSTLVLHNELKPFLLTHFPTIKLAVDIEKEAFVSMLVSSGAFSTTHYAISKLAPYKAALTKDDVLRLAEAVTTNTQIGWISSDADVREFYQAILPPHLDALDATMKAELTSAFDLV